MLELNQCYNMDCMEGMAQFPDGFFDLAVVDPPYFSGPERRGYYGSKVSKIGVYRDYPVSPAWEIPGRAYFDELRRVSKHYIVWGCNYFNYEFAPGRIVWDKCKKGTSFSDCELAATDIFNTVRLFRFMWNGMLQGKWLAAPWYATTYEKDKQFFNPVGTVEHKTPVTVIEQELTGGEYGKDFSGYLLVERVDNGEQFYISVTDFVTEPYWETTSATEVGYTNPCLAVYHQCSDYYPVDRNGKKYNAADGEVVMIFGATNWGGIDRETNQVDVLGANGRGFFNAEDLTVIY